MFAGPITIQGVAGTPLPTPGGFGADPVILVFREGSNELSSTNFAGTIDWGDGTTTDAAMFAAYDEAGSFYQYVDGPEHTYQTPGNYTITIDVTGPGDASPTVYQDATIIAPAPITITGAINPQMVAGIINLQNVTASNTPNFLGTTQPGASVVLSAMNVATGQTSVIGTSVANDAGQWSVTSVPLADGDYLINGVAESATGATAGASASYVLSDNTDGNPVLTIDATGPQITGFRVINAKTGAFMVTYADPVGLTSTALTAPATYTVTRIAPKPRKGQTFAVTNLIGVFGVTTSDATVSSPASVRGTLPITHNGIYLLTIDSNLVTSDADVPLDGAYAGTFPSGNGHPGSTFQVRITVHNGKATVRPVVIKPTKTGSHVVKVKLATSQRHA